MTPRYLDDQDVAAALSIPDAINCVDRAFRLLASGAAVNAVRQRLTAGPTTINVMWAIAPTEGVLGVKEYPTVEGSTRGVVLTLLLHSVQTGELLAVIQADRLGQLRTGAASAVASRALARPDSQVLALYGTGFQAELQVLSLAHVLPELRKVLVVGRTPDRRDALIARLRGQLEIEIAAADPVSAVQQADVIVTATGSPAPVVDGGAVRPGTHVNAIGSNLPTKREVDRTLLDRAAAVIVDDRTVAASECGDLLLNAFDVGAARTIGDVLLGREPGRTERKDITVFESQGLALQDVVCAGWLLGVSAERLLTEDGQGHRTC